MTWQRVAKCAAQLVEAEGDDENKIIVFPSDNTSALSSASAHQSRQLSAQRKIFSDKFLLHCGNVWIDLMV